MKGYLCLGAAILLEFFGTTCMKLSNGFEHKIYTGGTLICYAACFYFLALSLKTIDLNIAYATWGGLGIILAAAVSYFFFSRKYFDARNDWNCTDRDRRCTL